MIPISSAAKRSEDSEKGEQTPWHWSKDKYWTDALEVLYQLREAGQTRLTLDLTAIETVAFQVDGPAYKLMDAMESVRTLEGMEGYKGAPRILLAVLMRLRELSGNNARLFEDASEETKPRLFANGETSPMSIPDFQSIMLPLLELLDDGEDHTNAEISGTLARMFQLSDEELRAKLPSGQTRVFTNRLAWAKVYLKKAGLLESPLRGVSRITDQGKSVLAQKPAKIDIAFLKQLPETDWSSEVKCVGQQPGPADSECTPEEILESSYQELRAALADELLERVKCCSPQFFERLVVDLLVAMGYGGSIADAGQAIGKTGDGGIDGIIKEDKLGLDVVCVQAKRWENTVGRPVVQNFAGSMEGVRARKGVLLTTGSFSKEAEDYVRHIERKIVLIGGRQLAQLMIDHDIGVATARTYVVKKLDLDYFTEETG
ncbi:MAG: restriction endonuclease [Pirellulaceae bacterium]|nr:restriction endonuclease [Pirellulaceae bacterium]